MGTNVRMRVRCRQLNFNSSTTALYTIFLPSDAPSSFSQNLHQLLCSNPYAYPASYTHCDLSPSTASRNSHNACQADNFNVKEELVDG